MQPGLFEDLSSLSKLVLSIPSVSTLDSMVIKPLRALEFLEISNSSLTELPDGMFVGPTALRDVRLIGASSQEFLLPVCLNSAASSEQGKRVYHFSMVHGSPFELTIEYTAEGPLSTDTGHERSIKFKRGSATSEEFFLNDDRTKLVYSWGNSGKQEAHLVAVACSAVPEGHTRWTLRLLADEAVKLELTDSISRETVRQVLKKRTQAVAEEGVVHPQGERRVRGPHGGRAGPLCGTLMRNPMTPSGP